MRDVICMMSIYILYDKLLMIDRLVILAHIGLFFLLFMIYDGNNPGFDDP